MDNNEMNERDTTQTSAEPTLKKPKRSKARTVVFAAVGTVLIMMLIIRVFTLFTFIYFNYIHTLPRTVVTENGKTVYEYYKGLDRVKTETEYDKNDRMVKKTIYDDEGMLYKFNEYLYDENGVLTDEREYRFGDLSSIIKYDANGTAVIKGRFFFDELDYTSKYEYDRDGKLTREYIYGRNGELLGRREYEYKKDGGIRWDHYDSSGELTYSGEYKPEK